MIPELGHIALCLATVFALLHLLAPALTRSALTAWLPQQASAISTVIFFLISTALAAHIHAYAVSDFTVLNVILNSHSLKPMLYKITGSWGNHEGSMLLWLWVLSLFGFLVALTKHSDATLHKHTQHVLGALVLGLLLFILFTSNPFLRVFPPAPDGQGLNPLLQDVGLALHPPMLYLGYVGFGIVFAYAVAGLWLGRIDAAWARTVHPWILLSWGTLTAGIGLGSWWAYRELGWGGWWFWDPVENVSLLPWFAGGALMHANLVLATRGSFARWVALLAILSFSMSLIGTFIVRSGLITSVHAFASDPARGVFILAYIALATGIGLLVFSMRAPNSAPQTDGIVSRTGLIAVGNVILVTACASILLAILYPLFLTLAGLPSISVGPPYFNAVIVPLCTPLLVLSGVAALMPWQSAWQKRLRGLVFTSVPVTVLMGIGVFFFTGEARVPTFIGLTLAALLVAAVVHYLLAARRALPKGAGISHIPARRIASATGHLGLALFAAGVVGSSLFKTVIEAPMHKGDTITHGEYSITLSNVTGAAYQNYFLRRATLELTKNREPVAQLTPETRLYPVRGQETTESDVQTTIARDIVGVIGRANYQRGADDGTSPLGVRVYIVPLQQWVWYGFIFASVGSFIAAAYSLRRANRA